jgi:integrase
MASVKTPTPSLLPRVNEYIAQRRAFGYQLRQHERMLCDFARYADTIEPGQPISTHLALRWVCQQSVNRAHRLCVVRLFARFCALSDQRTEVPPARLVESHYARRAPHIYTSSQIRLILRRTAKLGTKGSPLRPYTFATFFGLLAVAGLRVGEACRVRLRDFDPHTGTLRVPATKYSAERVLPLHVSTVEALLRYQKIRRRLMPLGEHFFVGRAGNALSSSGVSRAFRAVAAGIKGSGERPRPRTHDFRHTFATNWIAQWSREALPITHYALRLSAYLGHRNIACTWWYISGDKKALDTAAARFGRYRHGRDSAV